MPASVPWRRRGRILYMRYYELLNGEKASDYLHCTLLRDWQTPNRINTRLTCKNPYMSRHVNCVVVRHHVQSDSQIDVQPGQEWVLDLYCTHPWVVHEAVVLSLQPFLLCPSQPWRNIHVQDVCTNQCNENIIGHIRKMRVTQTRGIVANLLGISRPWSGDTPYSYSLQVADWNLSQWTFWDYFQTG